MEIDRTRPANDPGDAINPSALDGLGYAYWVSRAGYLCAEPNGRAALVPLSCGSAPGDDLRERFADQPGSDSVEHVTWSKHAESEPHGEDRPAPWAEYKERKLEATTPEPAEPDVPAHTRSDSSTDRASPPRPGRGSRHHPRKGNTRPGTS